METDIILLDVATTLGIPVSPYTWRVRLFLNHRGFNYRTRWVSAVDIDAECISLNIPPTGLQPSKKPLYTVPAILDYTSSAVEPVAVSDSFLILRYLETTYPSASYNIFPKDKELLWADFNSFADANILLGGALFLTELARSKLPGDLAPFQSKVESLLGASWETLELRDKEREGAWEQLESSLSSSLERFGFRKDGRFLVGDTLSYADFVICAFFIFLKHIISQEDWRRVSAWNGGRWIELLQPFDDWKFVDGHPPQGI